MRVGNKEIFGPVLCIKRVKDFEVGLHIMNANEFANGASIFKLNGYYSREFTRRSDAGMVGVNVGIPVPISAFPFCGHKASFLGTCTAWAAMAPPSTPKPGRSPAIGSVKTK